MGNATGAGEGDRSMEARNQRTSSVVSEEEGECAYIYSEDSSKFGNISVFFSYFLTFFKIQSY